MIKSPLLWGIDLGGTKIELVVLKDTPDFEVLWRKRIPTGGHLGYDSILVNIQSIIQQASTDLETAPAKIGMGTPGIENPETGLMKNCNTIVLNGKALNADLEERTNIKFELANDANCFALAEAKMGAVPASQVKANVIFGVIMGTGVGGSIVHNGALINGIHGIAGEWGHHYLIETKELCYCGRSGCTEQFISGPALERYYHRLSGEAQNLKEIVQLYRKGTDNHAEKTMHRLFSLFARAISNVINILDPDVVVLGGGLGNIDELYSIGVPLVKDHIFNDRMDTVFLKPKLGDSAGVFGAALLNK